MKGLRVVLTLLALVVAALAAPLSSPLAAPASAAPTCASGQWQAAFFTGTTLTGTPVLQRCDDAVSFDWTAGSPGAGVPNDNFSARWTRTQTFKAGSHRFTAVADDGVRIRLDGVVVLDGWADQSATETLSATVPVTAGTHTVSVEYYEKWGDAALRTSYSLVPTPVTSCTGTAWRAQYFDGTALAGTPALQRCDAKIAFSWGAGSPHAAVDANRFSARWTRTVDLAAGVYEFRAAADDGVRVLVDGVLVVDAWSGRTGTSYAERVPLTQGSHTVVVEYQEQYGDATVSASFRLLQAAAVPACTGTQWTATYYAGESLAGSPLATRCDAAIAFSWGTGSPAAGVPADKFSSSWTRSVTMAAGTYTFTARGDDGVRIRLDGNLVLNGWTAHRGETLTRSVTVAAGQHTITVQHHENTGSALASASFAPTAGTDPRSGTGEWKQNPTDMPVRSVHTTLLPNGKVLMVAGSGNNQVMFRAGTFRATVWDPVANTFTEIPVPEDMFCAGHAHMADGNVMVAGGNAFYPNGDHGFGGIASNYEFDVATNRFVKLPSMREGRWYPTLTMLGDGDINVVGGLDSSGTGGTVLVERFDSVRKQWESDVSQRWAFWGLYPSLHLMDDGELFYSGTNTFGNAMPGSASWDLETDTVQDLPLSHPDLRDQSASILLPPAQDQKVMVMGGGDSYSGEVATDSTYIHDLASGQHYEGPPLPANKMYVNAVILPDRTVFETGGAELVNTLPQHESSTYDPRTNRFTPVPGTPAIDRMYHSSSLLLPDGRVAVFGSNPNEGSFEMRISIWSPGYLFRGARPAITQAPAVMDVGGQYDVKVTAPKGVREVSLIRPGSVTHQFDPNLRLVDVPFTKINGGLRLGVPDNVNLLPPGPYMLVVTDTDGVPSVASWVEVPAQAGQAATARTAAYTGQARHTGHTGHTAAAAQCDPQRPELCCCTDGAPGLVQLALHGLGRGATSTPDPPSESPAPEQPWWAPDANGLRPGEIDYGPDGGPTVTSTTIGDGCDRNYTGRQASVCVPIVARDAPDLGKDQGEPVTCGALRAEGYLRYGLRVVGEDTQGLDPDGDGLACVR